MTALADEEAVTGEPLGLSIASHSGLAPPEIGRLAAAAETAGFGAVFVAEGHGDALSLCHPVIAATTTAKGLKVTCRLDHCKYPIGQKITDEEFAHVNLKPDKFHGEWNYTIRPND